MKAFLVETKIKEWNEPSSTEKKIHTVDKHTSDVYYVNILVNFPKINREFWENGVRVND